MHILSWKLATEITGVLLLLWLAWRAARRIPWQRWFLAPADLAVPADGYFSEDDRTIENFRRWNEEDSRYDTRSIAELAAACPACGGDHPDRCDAEKAMDDNEVITGTISKVPDDAVLATGRGSMTAPYTIFEHAPETNERVGSVLALMDEIETQWHNFSGGWQPPSTLVSSLPDGDWLRELLVSA
jgi:hypothetical protein